MSGYVFVLGCCCACRAVIGFNPNHVPSLRVNGKREPLCPGCHKKWNEIHRVSKGLEPIEAHPDAWEPLPESEL